jgi:hypothetical protein
LTFRDDILFVRRSTHPMNRRQPLALAVVAMTVVGWNLGGNSTEKPSADPLPTVTRSSRPERVVRTRHGPTGEAAQRLEAIRATANPSERMRATIDLANSLSPADFGAWLGGGWFTLRGGMESTVFTQILMERWRQEDPEGHLLWCRENDSGASETLFMTWAETEPQRLLDFFKSHPDTEAELPWLQQIAEKHPELALRRFQEMIAAGISRDEISQAEPLIAELAKQSPAALEAILDVLPVSLKYDAEKILVGRKMQDSFATELRKLNEHPDGLQLLLGILDRTDDLEGKLIDNLTDLPTSWREQFSSRAHAFMRSEDAAKWAATDLEGAGFTAEQAKDIRAAAVSQLQRSEPEGALKILLELELHPDRKERMLTSLFLNLRDQPEKSEVLLALLSSDEERQIARYALQPVPDLWEPEIKNIEQPAEWLSAVTAPGLQDGAGYAHLSMLENWEPEKVAVLSAGFQSLPDDQKRNLSLLYLKRGMNSNLPLQGEVLAYFVANPPPEEVSIDPSDGFVHNTHQVAQLATRYVVYLGKENPEKAGGWIAALPDGEAKWYAARNLQSVWTLYDPAAAERWLKTLPAATREKVKTLQGD